MKKIVCLLFVILSAQTVRSQDRLYGNEFPLSDVKLLESPFSRAMDKNVEVLLQYDVDRLLAPYLKAAGLEPKGESFSCWERLDGHIGGHYLTALAIHYAATGNQELKERMEYMLSQLSMCGVARGDGYVGGVPAGDELWKALKEGDVDRIKSFWVPWYNLHKIYAGLRDTWVYAGSTVGRNLFLGMCDWGLGVISGLSDKQMEQMLATEFGGMDEVYADAYAITGDRRYLDAAKRFSHHVLYDAMRDGNDNLDYMHANTQVPKVVGYQRIAELGNDADYHKAARFFWDTVVNNRSLSIGGNSRREHFPSKGDAKSYVDDREGPESCNTNNMLKLTEGLFRMEPDARYADFYERALYNHILSTQHPDHGGYVYFTSARPGHYRVYSQPNSAMWCCVGTGMENHGKYGQFIYTHKSDSLWVNLFIPSRLEWKEKGVTLIQQTAFPVEGVTSLTLETETPRRLCLLLRHPGWSDKISVRVNGEKIKTVSSPSSYIALEREWKNGDRIEMEMPMKFTLEELNYLPDYVSIVRGPIVMGARFDNGTPTPGVVADDSRWGHVANGPLVSVFDTPLLIGERKALIDKLNKMKPADRGEMTWYFDVLRNDRHENVVLEPFYGIHDSRYMMYWLSMTPKDYKHYKKEQLANEMVKLELDRRTVDAVNTGEQQPEVDHAMVAKGSHTGNFNGEPWRDSAKNGFFSYKMNTSGYNDLILSVRYWGKEVGARKFDIMIDDTVIETENLADKWNVDKFVDQEYKIPAELLDGKNQVTVKFRGHEGHTAGGIYYVRLMKPAS